MFSSFLKSYCYDRNAFILHFLSSSEHIINKKKMSAHMKENEEKAIPDQNKILFIINLI